MQSRSRFDHRAPAYSRFVRPVQPAGQAFDDFTSFYGNTTGGTTTGGTTTGTDANIPGKTPTDAGADNTALYGAVSSFLGQTATTIQAIVNGGNQVEIARLNNQTREQIATLQAQAAQAQREGNQALAAQQAAAAAQLQQFQALLAARQQPANTALYIVGGLAVLGILAGVVYFATRPKHNPRARIHGPKTARMYLERVRLDRGGYTSRGRYFGIGAPLYRYYGDDIVDIYGREHGYVDDYVRAESREAAMHKIRQRYPNVRFTGRQ